jgi:gas vesicle protein
MEFVKGLLVGCALGAAAALLYAPKSGAETRAQLSSQATAEWELAQAKMHKGMESLQAQLESVQAELEKLTEQQEELAEEIEELPEEEA